MLTIAKYAFVCGLILVGLAFIAPFTWLHNTWIPLLILIPLLALLIYLYAFLRKNRQTVEKALNELKEWKRQAKLVLSSMGEGMFGVNLEGELTFINDAALRMLGYRLDELRAKKIMDLIRPMAMDQEEPSHISAHVKENLGIEVLNESFTRKDGSLLPVAYTCSPVLTENSVTGAIYVFRDDTERRNQDAELRKSNAFIRSILDHARSLIFAKTISGEYLVVNSYALKLFGFTEEQMLGKTDDQLFPHECADSWRSNDLLALEANKAIQVEETLRLPDGSSRSYLSVKFPLVDAKGQVYAVGGMSTDITDRVNQERRLTEYLHQIEQVNQELEEARHLAETANAAKSTFLANVSHEIRTPLNGIIGITSLLQCMELSEKQRNYVQKIQFSSKILLDLVNDLLDCVKIEAGQMKLENVATNLTQLVRKMGEIIAIKAEEKKLDLIIRIAPDVPKTVLVDPTRLQQIILNLANNAVKFTQQGFVLISVSQKEDRAGKSVTRIDVQDSGIGISREKQSQLFQKFYQADDSTTRNYGGTGLGLAISKQLVDLMNGRIGVESEEGKGSAFWIELPLSPAEEGATTKESRSLQVPVADLRGISILIVDDIQMNIEVLEGFARYWNMSFRSCQSAQEALEWIKKEDFHLALIDYMMPGMNGIDLARSLSGNEKTKEMPLILLTSVRHLDPELSARNGFSAQLTKPFYPEELLEAIHAVLPNAFQKE